jgi:hypothetical protein
VIEFIPLVSGVEYGKFIPNATFAMGVRTPGGFEMGLGPNVSAYKSDGDPAVRTSLVTAVGKSLNYGGVSIPINLVLATNPQGNRISLIFGYAVGKSPRSTAARPADQGGPGYPGWSDDLGLH